MKTPEEWALQEFPGHESDPIIGGKYAFRRVVADVVRKAVAAAVRQARLDALEEAAGIADKAHEQLWRSAKEVAKRIRTHAEELKRQNAAEES